MAEHTPHYPVFLALAGRLAIVVGGDAAAVRKTHQFVECGADVAVITPFPNEHLRQLEADGVITLERRGYMRGDLKGAFIAYCSLEPNDDEIGQAVFAEAETLGCLINVADHPALSSYIMPSSVRRGQLQIAISTSGAAPAVARRLRRELRERFGVEWAAYIALLGEIRVLTADRIADAEERESLLAASADADYLERLAAGEKIEAETAFAALLTAVASSAAASTGSGEPAPSAGEGA